MNKRILAAAAIVVGLGLLAGRFGEHGGVAPANPAMQAPASDTPARPAPASATGVPAPPLASDVARVPIAAVDASTPAWLPMAQARENGDARTPPLVRGAPRSGPDAAQLTDHQAYAAYELAQKKRLAAAYVEAASTELVRLQSDLEAGRAAGVPPAELAKVAEKIRRIGQQQRVAEAILSDRKVP